jgi:hypothetical protein
MGATRKGFRRMAAAKPKKNKAANPANAAKAVLAKRYALAEAACHAVMGVLVPMEKAEAFAEHETARQYAQMARVYYHKIRNGKVLSPGDFNTAVDVCTAARRALKALDPELKFADWPQAEALLEAERQASAVLREYHTLTGVGQGHKSS